MRTQTKLEPKYLVDKDSNVLGNLDVHAVENGLYRGELLSAKLPPELLDALRELEEIVDDQVFSLLDEVQDRIDRFELAVQCTPGGPTRRIEDVQLFEGRRISFRVAE